MTTAVVRVATRGSALARWQADHVARAAAGRRPRRSWSSWWWSRPRATAAWTSPSGSWAARACSSRRCRPPCSTAGPTWPCTRPRTCRRSPTTDLVIACVPDAGRSPRRAGRLHPGRAGPRRGGGHRLGAAAGPAGLGCGPDLTFAGLRGNIDTRLGRAHEFGAIVMAAAALERLDRLEPRSPRCSSPSVMLPQVGQGALAVECRRADDRARWRGSLAAIEHRPSRRGRRGRAGLPGRAGG